MAPTAPVKSAMKVPEKEFDSKGKIKNWSVLWEEARDLEALVATGRSDSMSPAAIRTKYPQYNAFSYRAFYSGLNNIRKKHNKEVNSRSEHEKADGECEFNLFSSTSCQ
jgi:hypothetical protein